MSSIRSVLKTVLTKALLAKALLACVTLLTGAGLWLPSADVLAQPVTQPFTFNVAQHELPAILHGGTTWGDFDGDGDLDLLLTGQNAGEPLTWLMLNQGRENDVLKFHIMTGPFQQVLYSKGSFADIDGDGDLDALVTGSRTATFPYVPATDLYRLGGLAPVERIENHGLPQLHSADMAWADMDADGDQDVVMLGTTADDEPLTVIGYNQGNGTFESHTDLLPAISYGDVALGDIDGDLDVDVVLSGASANGFVTLVLRNEGDSFAPINASFPEVAFSSVDLGDFDGDADLDLVVSGGRVSERLFEGVLEIWSNIGGSFSKSDHELSGVLAGDVTWGDYDQDGDLDLLVQGAEAAIGSRTARVWRNDGAGGFVASTFLVGSIFADTEFGDLDGDGDLDLIATGRSSLGPSFTNIYENQRQVIPPLPGVPQSLASDVSGQTVLLSWLPPANQDAVNLMTTYNVRVGTSPGASNVVSALADATSGRRWVSAPGNASVLDQMLLDNLEDGTYFWSVQSVNNAFLASPFSAEGTFTISAGMAVDTEEDLALPTRFAVHGNYPNPFDRSTTIQFDLPESADVQFRVISLLGKEVYRQALGVTPAGSHELRWDGHTLSGSQLGAGIYFYEVRASGRSATGTMTLVR